MITPPGKGAGCFCHIILLNESYLHSDSTTQHEAIQMLDYICQSGEHLQLPRINIAVPVIIDRPHLSLNNVSPAEVYFNSDVQLPPLLIPEEVF